MLTKSAIWVACYYMKLALTGDRIQWATLDSAGHCLLSEHAQAQGTAAGTAGK